MSDTKDDILDLDDPRLKEPQSYDPEADADAFIPIAELDSKGNVIDYLLRLSLGESKYNGKHMYFKQTDKSGVYGVLMIDLNIVDPGGLFDKAKLRSQYLTTIVQKKTNASGITNLARLLKSPMAKNLSLQDQAEHIEKLLGAEPTLLGNVQWRTYCSNCEEEISRLVGERNWPEKKDEAGNVIGHIPKAECPTCKGDVVPNVELKRFIDA